MPTGRATQVKICLIVEFLKVRSVMGNTIVTMLKSIKIFISFIQRVFFH